MAIVETGRALSASFALSRADGCQDRDPSEPVCWSGRAFADSPSDRVHSTCAPRRDRSRRAKALKGSSPFARVGLACGDPPRSDSLPAGSPTRGACGGASDGGLEMSMSTGRPSSGCASRANRLAYRPEGDDPGLGQASRSAARREAEDVGRSGKCVIAATDAGFRAKTGRALACNRGRRAAVAGPRSGALRGACRRAFPGRPRRALPYLLAPAPGSLSTEEGTIKSAPRGAGADLAGAGLPKPGLPG